MVLNRVRLLRGVFAVQVKFNWSPSKNNGIQLGLNKLILLNPTNNLSDHFGNLLNLLCVIFAKI